MNFTDRLSNTNGWLYLLIMTITVLVAIFVTKSFIEFLKEDSPVKKQKASKKALLSLFGFIVMVFFLFLNFGPGEPDEKTPFEETGEYETLKKIDSEPSKDELKKDVLQRTTNELIIQSDDSLRKKYLDDSEKKSSEIVNEYLKK